jgi:hypothetical protein
LHYLFADKQDTTTKVNSCTLWLTYEEVQGPMLWKPFWATFCQKICSLRDNQCYGCFLCRNCCCTYMVESKLTIVLPNSCAKKCSQNYYTDLSPGKIRFLSEAQP